jgi:hypothetical protein
VTSKQKDTSLFSRLCPQKKIKEEEEDMGKIK